jgi:hypothetical protein
MMLSYGSIDISTQNAYSYCIIAWVVEFWYLLWWTDDLMPTFILVWDVGWHMNCRWFVVCLCVRYTQLVPYYTSRVLQTTWWTAVAHSRVGFVEQVSEYVLGTRQCALCSLSKPSVDADLAFSAVICRKQGTIHCVRNVDVWTCVNRFIW